MCLCLCLAKFLQFIVTNQEIAAKFFRWRALPSPQTGADDEEIDGCLLYWYGILVFLYSFLITRDALVLGSVYQCEYLR